MGLSVPPLMADASITGAEPVHDATQSVRGANYMLALLYAAYVLNFVDRQLMTLLLNDIRKDLGLSDWQLGLASGTSFAVLYTAASIPVAYLADRSNRTRLLAICIGLWSVMTAACGFVGSFMQLLLARMGVAIGESGGLPASLAIIADLFPRHVRHTKLGIYFSAAAIGTMLSYVIGGYINAAIGWRWTFMVFAVPGVLLSLLLALTGREPKRGQFGDAPAEVKRTILSALVALLKVPVCRQLYIATALANLTLYALLTWAPSVALRSFALDTATVGLVMGVLGGGATAISIIGTGWLSDRLHAMSASAPIYMVAGCTLVLALLLPVCFFAPNFTVFVVAFTLCYAVGATYSAPCIAAVQEAAPPDLKAMSSAILLMLGTLAGLGLGPLLIGIISDLLLPAYGDESLRYSLLVLSPIAAASSAVYLYSGLQRAKVEPIIAR
jgi:MFS family permease